MRPGAERAAQGGDRAARSCFGLQVRRDGPVAKPELTQAIPRHRGPGQDQMVTPAWSRAMTTPVGLFDRPVKSRRPVGA